MNTGFQLFQLQEIDSAIDKANLRIDEIKASIMKDTECADAESNYQNLEKRYIESKRIFDELNDEVQSKKLKKAQSESSLYSGTISNPKELQDLQKEISSLSGVISKLEDELLEKLIDLESSEKKMLNGKKNLKETISDFETCKALLLGEKNQLEGILLTQLEQKNSITSQINQTDLEIYQSLRSSKNRIAVSKLVEHSCSICGSSLTASQCQQARSPGKLFFCTSCGRIIYGS